ncbi:DUF2537 domain-containing protein [Actinokineospora bangkokensis]|uniref:DUF2537 domain-containing protein n=1 Tax=Actinokineospora bangkokensis TaxID=1193682 RepID=A0A1Q9LCY9_9PSEU|nr:DUF2537 domain-containing protein [Actinokineospora bangkokensis]OLR89879.1 hypothetical protein BJP25_02415 [Actinokineospora bangkokensis]
MRLHVEADHPVLTGDDGTGPRAVDPATLPLDRDLVTALTEWARVARAVDGEDAGALVTRRGLQLAARLATAMNHPIDYVDPITGGTTPVRPAPRQARPAPAPTGEPTPWLTGLTLSAFLAAITVVAVVALAITLHDTNPVLPLVSNLVVTAGLLPSIWLARRTPTWRWVSYGVATGIALSWLVLPFVLFS